MNAPTARVSARKLSPVLVLIFMFASFLKSLRQPPDAMQERENQRREKFDPHGLRPF